MVAGDCCAGRMARTNWPGPLLGWAAAITAIVPIRSRSATMISPIKILPAGPRRLPPFPLRGGLVRGGIGPPGRGVTVPTLPGVALARTGAAAARAGGAVAGLVMTVPATIPAPPSAILPLERLGACFAVVVPAFEGITVGGAGAR